ncbi:hypothetical protein SD71_05700 [Cohnella kolymensis]|uniref:Polysaccharide biosynthesis protein GumN n=1 Tax=Cohnella kolymensis TaxID=1590652 RepID=A0ABR5A746_9BACL|nr:TraB/GumN family protein [Cohnella kolymensis]KIL36884.1 hypothetical protein SD71_05700 [Cohnella kolymensis]
MRKRLHRIAGLLLLLAAGLTACSPGNEPRHQLPAAAAEAAVSNAQAKSQMASVAVKKPGSKGFLWKITGGRNAGYLLGTIHVATEEMYPLDYDLQRAIAESDHVALELDLTKVNQFKAMKLVNQAALLTDGSSLEDHVSSEDYVKFGQVLKERMGAGTALFDKYEPWYAAMTLEALPAMKYMNTDGIDKYIAKQAHKHGKTVIELESVEQQIGLFDHFSSELQKLYFHQSIGNADQAAEGLDRLLDLWTAGEPAELDQLHAEYVKQGKQTMGKLFKDFDNSFLIRRNREIAEKIDGFLSNGETGTYMVAVGAMHMPGEQGLVSLLEEAGYKLEFII